MQQPPVPHSMLFFSRSGEMTENSAEWEATLSESAAAAGVLGGGGGGGGGGGAGGAKAEEKEEPKATDYINGR